MHHEKSQKYLINISQNYHKRFELNKMTVLVMPSAFVSEIFSSNCRTAIIVTLIGVGVLKFFIVLKMVWQLWQSSKRETIICGPVFYFLMSIIGKQSIIYRETSGIYCGLLLVLFFKI